MVRRQNGHARVSWHARREPVRHALRHPRQLREGDTLHRLLPLNLKGNVVGELPGRFLKSLVEGGHGFVKSSLLYPDEFAFHLNSRNEYNLIDRVSENASKSCRKP